MTVYRIIPWFPSSPPPLPLLFSRLYSFRRFYHHKPIDTKKSSKGRLREIEMKEKTRHYFHRPGFIAIDNALQLSQKYVTNLLLARKLPVYRIHSDSKVAVSGTKLICSVRFKI